MTTTQIDAWRLPGCGPACLRGRHDPDAHEAYGRLLERESLASRVVCTRGLMVDLTSGIASLNGEELALTRRSWELLAYLARRPGQWITGDDVLRDVWGAEWVTRIYRTTRDDGRRRADIGVVNVTRNRLRASLGPARHLIETRNRGICAADMRLRIEDVTP